MVDCSGENRCNGHNGDLAISDCLDFVCMVCIPLALRG